MNHDNCIVVVDIQHLSLIHILSIPHLWDFINPAERRIKENSLSHSSRRASSLKEGASVEKVSLSLIHIFLPEYIVRPALAAGRLARLNVPD